MFFFSASQIEKNLTLVFEISIVIVIKMTGNKQQQQQQNLLLLLAKPFGILQHTLP